MKILKIINVSIIMVILGFTTTYAELYKIGPGDILEISVWKDPELSRDVIVPPDGIISFPLIGSVDTDGKTVSKLKQIITTKLSDYLPDASVTVIIKKINSLKAYVIGKVKNPGMFSISLDTSVMQVLSMAKGLNPFASQRNIHILRTMNGSIKKIKFDYKEVLNGKNLEQNILLIDGDVIVVP